MTESSITRRSLAGLTGLVCCAIAAACQTTAPTPRITQQETVLDETQLSKISDHFQAKAPLVLALDML